MKPECWNESGIARARELRAEFDRDPGATKQKILDELAEYYFFHNIEVVPGIKTSGFHWVDPIVQSTLDACASIDFRDKRVLDVGCRDGDMSLFAEAKRAREIVAVDSDPSPGLVNFVIPFRNSIIQPLEGNVNYLDRLGIGQFDIIFCCGLLYHL